LQVEVCTPWRVVPTRPRDVVVLDYLSLGPQTPSGFYARKVLYDAVMASSPFLRNVMEIKTWQTDYEDASENAYACRWEGLVIVRYNAPIPTWESNDLSLFVKFVPTVETLIEGSVVEVTLDGKFVKIRPDKAIPDDEAKVERVKASIPLDCFNHIHLTRYSAVAEDAFLSRLPDEYTPSQAMAWVLVAPGARSVVVHPNIDVDEDGPRDYHVVGADRATLHQRKAKRDAFIATFSSIDFSKYKHPPTIGVPGSPNLYISAFGRMPGVDEDRDDGAMYSF